MRLLSGVLEYQQRAHTQKNSRIVTLVHGKTRPDQEPSIFSAGHCMQCSGLTTGLH
jgi:hypothetical protein